MEGVIEGSICRTFSSSARTNGVREGTSREQAVRRRAVRPVCCWTSDSAGSEARQRATVARVACRFAGALDARSAVDSDGELSEGAGGELGQPLRDVLEAVGPHDRDADDAGGSRVGELREGGRDGARHDRCEGDVVAAELLGSQAEGRCDPAAGGEEGYEYSSVAGEVQHRFDTVWVLVL